MINNPVHRTGKFIPQQGLGSVIRTIIDHNDLLVLDRGSAHRFDDLLDRVLFIVTIETFIFSVMRAHSPFEYAQELPADHNDVIYTAHDHLPIYHLRR